MDSKTHILTQYLNGELSVEEMTLIEEKILNLPDWKEEFELLQQIFSVADSFEYPESKKTESAWVELSEKLTTEIVPIKVIIPVHRFNWLKYAAIIALLSVASIGIYNISYNPEVEWISSTSRIDKQLPDGSWIVLQPNSSINFKERNFKSKRKVHVTGNVYFTVVKDQSHPFEVIFQRGELKVTGTRFMIKQDQTATLISLFTGSLKVSSGKSNRLLKPGQSVTVTEGSIPLIAESISDPISELYTLNFRDAHLEDIIKGLENRFEVRIRFPEKLRQQQYTVQAEGLPLDDILKVLAELTGTVVQKYPDYFELKF